MVRGEVRRPSWCSGSERRWGKGRPVGRPGCQRVVLAANVRRVEPKCHEAATGLCLLQRSLGGSPQVLRGRVSVTWEPHAHRQRELPAPVQLPRKTPCRFGVRVFSAHRAERPRLCERFAESELHAYRADFPWVLTRRSTLHLRAATHLNTLGR